MKEEYYISHLPRHTVVGGITPPHLAVLRILPQQLTPLLRSTTPQSLFNHYYTPMYKQDIPMKIFNLKILLECGNRVITFIRSLP